MSDINRISAQQAQAMLDNGAVLVDVRENAEFNTMHIPNANLLPLGTIQAANLSEHQEKNILVYCQKGVRGDNACKKVQQENPTLKLFNIDGGIEAWQQAGFATQKGSSNVLPLDRQVQIMIGSVVLSCSLLGYFYHPNFIFVPAFMGAGILFVGISGFCGLARLMAMAPWNK